MKITINYGSKSYYCSISDSIPDNPIEILLRDFNWPLFSSMKLVTILSGRK